ncbi:MAG: TSUP family transporter [Bacteroidota bacterium]|mgnify:FL=1|jgi:uncharacterized membrane protein YfcA|nr:TSUP family transporter [Bacteroidales bacterium]MDI9535025.1 TSUP family transporter [Bacteroidota bacterium]OQC46597.1 MAG: hypothetical protein BWX59_00290 [Bacteroidetes bacterium ADurb.Bin028]NLP19343.1 TSUP family transporter [Bacteroidales bacterium]HNY43980.1 TSUP family transporter [Bacteroidales bacterium]
MDFSITVILLLCLAYFVAGFIDSIAGGGGLITLPSLLFAGVPPQFALGTNKMASTLGTGVAVVNFWRNKKINFKLILSGIGFAMLGAFLGSKIILSLDQSVVGKIIIFLLPVAVVAVLLPRTKKSDAKALTKIDYFVIVPIICLVIGFYDGFFGPGTGSFLTLSLFFFTKLKLIEATANAKVFNVMSNVGSLVAFILGGKVLFLLAIPFALSNMLGNFLGSRLAIKSGDRIIKYFLILSLSILLISLVWKYYF